MFREFFRELLSANLFVTGIILTVASIVIFYGTIYLLTYTNVGKKLGFLVTGTGISGWMTISSLLFVIYAPRGPRPVEIEGLNAFEIKVIPLTFMIVSAIVFAMFLVALRQYEESQDRADL